MKEFIAKLSKGIFEYGVPEIEVSISSIELDLEADVVFKGSFEISCPEGEIVKGLVFSKGEHFAVTPGQFLGARNTITYEVSTAFMEAGDVIGGNIHIVARGKKIEIPWAVSIKPSGIMTSIGEIHDMDSFCELWKEDYDEALSIFCNGDFKKLLRDNENRYISLYETLLEGNNKPLALEEFLIAAERKKGVEISLVDHEREYSGLAGTSGDTLLILKDRQGYLSFRMEADAEFIELPRKQFSSSDFTGNRYEFPFCLAVDKMHAGTNFGRITISSHRQKLQFEITVRNGKTKSSRNRQRSIILDLIRLKMEYKLKRINLYEWRQESERLLEKIGGAGTPQPLESLFFQVEIMLEQERFVEAEELMGLVAEELIRANREDKDLYARYLYYTTIIKKDSAHSEAIRRQIQEYYENGCDSFMLLWILLRLDRGLKTNQPLKLARLKEQYRKGCRNPFLYLEVLDIYNENPKELNSLNPFDMSVLFFGAKKECLSLDLARRTAGLALSEKGFHPLVFSILEHLYGKFEDEIILDAVCSVLIKGSKTDEKYFKWFALGVEKGSKITKLYEYFMYSISTGYTGPLPPTVLMYFLYNTEALHDRQAYLFYNVIVNKKELSALYRSYLRRMERYAVAEIKRGNINEFLNVIYWEVLGEGSMDAAILENLPDITCSYRLRYDNPNVSRVLVCYDELAIVNEGKLTENETNLVIYTENFHVIFEDLEGNRYSQSLPHSLYRYVDEKKYRQCFLQNPNSEVFIIRSIGEVLKITKNHVKTMDILLGLSRRKVFRCWYLKQLMGEAVDYYNDHCYDEALDRYLPAIEADCLYSDTRKTIISMLIKRELYEDAYKLFARYGIQEMEPGKMMRMSLRFIADRNFMPDSTLLSMCMYAFENGKYNETLLQYIGTYFLGPVKEMLAIWSAQKQFCCENRELEENLLAVMLYAGSFPEMRFPVFHSYYLKGGKEEIRNAFYNYVAYEYIMKEKPAGDEYVQHIEMEIQERFSGINDICRMAYLKYNADVEYLLEYQIRLCEKIMEDFISRDIRLNFFKKYAKWFPISDSLKDKLIIEYKADPATPKTIRYYISSGDGGEKQYLEEEMNCIYPGIFTWEIILFYGESVRYHIKDESKPGDARTRDVCRKLHGEELYMGENRYGIINNIILAMDMKDDETVSNLMLQYLVNGHITKNLFEVDERES
ncbi:DUF5717 family protein [Parasporobacterium paucivorans]|uniref:DUF5717 domain-containing protein n=1 Tax=Parasporobacterium paucivorans DSM 15970 TaxID=1122934 RepID=A0A1M6CE41_9FIRM|nr:DUF5717 family protein [Parasporobacterium paucivorans]SHI58968.1 hypothetical protein SAMN02745691_00536 [Parasporobacterium paucivorans DSM 15970]